MSEEQQQQQQQYLQQQQQYQQYLAQLQQYNATQQTATPQQPPVPQYSATQQIPQYPGYPPQYPPQYLQQPSYPPIYTPFSQPQFQNRGFQQGSQHSDRVLWVGNLHQEVNENELREFFEPFGTINNIKLVQTKACAFISFSEPQAATRAHNEMNHHKIHGQEIKIGWGKADNPQGGGGYGQTPYGGGAGGANPNTNRIPDINKELPHMNPSPALWVGNVTTNVTEQLLREVFAPYGSVQNVRIMLQKNCAFVTYSTVEEATNAKNSVDKMQVAGTCLRVNFGKI